MTISYRDAGVDIEAGDALVKRIAPLAARTRTPHVLADVGGFAGLCRIPPGLSEPVLVSGTDGVGTKLKVAFATGQHDTIGIDLVAMCVNDVLTTGASPLFFLDYFATGRLSVDVGEAVVKGIAAGCEQAGCALLGGETAEMPGMYRDGEYDLAGFAVGVVERARLMKPANVVVGDVILGLASSGLHSNGYSLARRIVDDAKLGFNDVLPGTSKTVGDQFLTPTRIYVKPILSLLGARPDAVHAMSHITGGGLVGNLPRVLPPGTRAVVERNALPEAPLFSALAELGPVAPEEMLRTFNLGVGMCLVVAAGEADAVEQELRQSGENVIRLGVVEAGEPGVASMELR